MPYTYELDESGRIPGEHRKYMRLTCVPYMPRAYSGAFTMQVELTGRSRWKGGRLPVLTHVEVTIDPGGYGNDVNCMVPLRVLHHDDGSAITPDNGLAALQGWLLAWGSIVEARRELDDSVLAS